MATHLRQLADIEFGKPYYFWQDRRWPYGVEAIVFDRFENPSMVSGTLTSADGATTETVYILASELGRWLLSPDSDERSLFKDTHTKTNRSFMRKEQAGLVARFPAANTLVDDLKRHPEVVATIRRELARFRECRDLSLFHPHRDASYQVVLGWQSQPTCRPGPFDYEIRRADGIVYNVTIAQGFYDKVLYPLKSRKLLCVGYCDYAWGAILEWIDRQDVDAPETPQ